MVATSRRHGPELVRAIQGAVLAEIAERGYTGTTYDGVAARAGTSKPVLYRRWPTKAQLVLGALVAVHPAPVVPADSGSLAGDLTALLSSVRAAIESSGRRTVLSLLAEISAADGVTVRELMFDRGIDVLESLVERARHRGELGEVPLPPAVVSVALDLARHELLVDGALPDDTIAVIVDQIAVPLLVMRSRADRSPRSAPASPASSTRGSRRPR